MNEDESEDRRRKRKKRREKEGNSSDVLAIALTRGRRWSARHTNIGRKLVDIQSPRGCRSTAELADSCTGWNTARSSRDMYINRALSSQGEPATAGIPPIPWSLEPKKLFSNRNPVTLQVVYGEYWKIESPLPDTEPPERDACHPVMRRRLFARRLKIELRSVEEEGAGFSQGLWLLEEKKKLNARAAAVRIDGESLIVGIKGKERKKEWKKLIVSRRKLSLSLGF